jgi:hypothetical protein
MSMFMFVSMSVSMPVYDLCCLLKKTNVEFCFALLAFNFCI